MQLQIPVNDIQLPNHRAYCIMCAFCSSDWLHLHVDYPDEGNNAKGIGMTKKLYFDHGYCNVQRHLPC